MTTLYAIPNCDTVKKARAWLTAQGIAYQFHDYKKHGVPAARVKVWFPSKHLHGVPAARVKVWMETLGWEPLLNKKGTAWRKLEPAVQAAVVDAASALACMQQNPSVIKRPVIEWDDGRITVGLVGLS
jgi:Spx/MgsR family transcriptional regulator